MFWYNLFQFSLCRLLALGFGTWSPKSCLNSIIHGMSVLMSFLFYKSRVLYRTTQLCLQMQSCTMIQLNSIQFKLFRLSYSHLKFSSAQVYGDLLAIHLEAAWEQVRWGSVDFSRQNPEAVLTLHSSLLFSPCLPLSLTPFTLLFSIEN